MYRNKHPQAKNAVKLKKRVAKYFNKEFFLIDDWATRSYGRFWIFMQTREISKYVVRRHASNEGIMDDDVLYGWLCNQPGRLPAEVEQSIIAEQNPVLIHIDELILES